MNRRGFGAEGERAARDYLAAKGAAILEMNYRRPTGESDTIARQGEEGLVGEGKRRATLRYGRPAEAVTPAKRARILNTAALYLQERGFEDVPVRFDVVEILPGRIRHIENAFLAGE